MCVETSAWHALRRQAQVSRMASSQSRNGSKGDWFRRTSWSEHDQREFERRLQHARVHSRAQYLRIQAVHLAEAGNAELLQASIRLADRMLAEYPDDWQVAWVHELRAECYDRSGDMSRAVQCYRQALEAERRRPDVRSNAWLGFGWLAIRHGLTSRYAEAEALLEEFATEIPFPNQRYRFHSIRAISAAHKGCSTTAQVEAALALKAAAAMHSGFRYHPTVGLVSDASDEVRPRLAALVAASQAAVDDRRTAAEIIRWVEDAARALPAVAEGEGRAERRPAS